MTYYGNIREEELKLKVGREFFNGYDSTSILGDVDFCVMPRNNNPRQMRLPFDKISFLWAESKRGEGDLLDAFAQLIITIGKARTFDEYLPPAFLGAFNADRIAFVPYSDVIDVFYMNDFNWNVAPSNHDTKEFKLIQSIVEKSFRENSCIFQYGDNMEELRTFIKDNFTGNFNDVRCIQITKNNFVSVYLKWRRDVMPTINIDWNTTKKYGILDADFYLADLLSEHNLTLRERLNVVLRKTNYQLNRRIDELGLFNASSAFFTDDMARHREFWNKYAIPPKREYWDYIIERRDLLIPQDIRERRGSFFTPQIWVEKSQEYLAAALGENWQDEYYVWDCCCGTGNLEAGLLNRVRIWASTLDKSDVDVMKERIANGANLLDGHVFQFDFLNDSFDKLPKRLKEIIDNPETRRRLVIYINPPYAEHGNARQESGTGKNKSKVATESNIYWKSTGTIGTAARELFAQFLYRIYTELDGCVIGQFSKLKHLQGQNFKKFRQFFLARLRKAFIVPSNTFDNVSGRFPIGFFVWDTSVKESFTRATADVFDEDGLPLGVKNISAEEHLMIEWLRQYYDRTTLRIGFLRMCGGDMQHNNDHFLTLKLSANDMRERLFAIVTSQNLMAFSIYFTARHCIENTWLNDRDMYLWPKDEWRTDTEFHSDCLAYTIFSRYNNIKSADGVNHWIPFTEDEANAQEEYRSHFLLDFMAGRYRAEAPRNRAGETQTTFAYFNDENENGQSSPIKFSNEAKAVFSSAREVWRLYHSEPDAMPDASFYEIREHFQGRNPRGVMNPDSDNAEYMRLMEIFKSAYKQLSEKIEPKIYEYGFLIR